MKTLSRLLVCSVALVLLMPSPAAAQSPPKREVRAAWVATVTNLDWPLSRGGNADAQKADLAALFESLRGLGINVIIFQVRTECDALYDSPYEPWSYWLTGSQGTPPSPYFDPLAFAIDEAHKRGMELHAWFNPYRAERVVGNYPLASNHVTVQHPSWAITIGTLKFLDPGRPEVRNFVATVITDVVRRYDVDGIHFDDYFYPYPPNQISNQDDATFTAYPRGFTDRGAWRRDNINLLLKAVNDSIQAIKPFVRFGMSPFGIWKNGVPPGITGLDAYNTIYCDAIAWLQGKIIDYLTPQLYWQIGGGQDYAKLMPWWADSVAAHGRHFYPGHAAYRMSSSSSNWPSSELANQVRLDRGNPKTHGSVFFRAGMGLADNLKGFGDTLRTNFYRTIALSPVMAWKDAVPPNPPRAIRFARVEGTGVSAIQWDLPIIASDGDSANRYVIYRFDHHPAGTEFSDPANILAVVGERSYVPPPPPAGGTYYYAVTALDRNHNEGDTSNVLLIAPPTPPVAVAPPNGATGVSDVARMVWSPTQASSVYRLQVSTDSLFATGIMVDDSTLTDTSYAVAGLQGFTTYYWRVRAGNAGGTGVFSAFSSFTTGFPVSPTLLAPAHLTLDIPLSPTFVWRAASTATSYRFQISLLTDFSTLVLDTAGIADTTLAMTGLGLNRVYNWRVKASSPLGTSPWSDAFRFRTVQVSEVAEDEELPSEYALSQNFPNPFNPTTSIRFSIPRAGRVVITVFDLLGREETTLVNSDMPVGTYTVTWDASRAASGMYFYRMTSGDFTSTKRMLLVR